MAKKQSVRSRWEERAKEADQRLEEHEGRRAQRRRELNQLSIAQVLNRYWFWLALLFLILMPLLDVLQFFRLGQGDLGRSFLANGLLGLVVSLPVVLPYLWAWRRGEVKPGMKLRAGVVLGLTALWLVLGLGFQFF